MTTAYFTAKVKAWGSLRTRRVSVDADGAARVYDPTAGYYTTCHNLSAGQVRRLRSLAARCSSPPSSFKSLLQSCRSPLRARRLPRRPPRSS